MRHLIPTLFIVLVLSPSASGSERLQFGSAAQKVEERGFTSALVRAAIFTRQNRYYQQDKITAQSEVYNYKKRSAVKDPAQTVQNPLNCFNSLAPDYCWYTGTAEVNNPQPAADLAFEYFNKSAPGSEGGCSTVDRSCDKLYNQDGTYINVATAENPAQQKKTVSTRAQVKLDFFSISIIF